MTKNISINKNMHANLIMSKIETVIVVHLAIKLACSQNFWFNAMLNGVTEYI